MPLESKNVKVFNNCASNPLVELVTTLMGGGSNGARFRHLSRCDVVGVNVSKSLLIDFVEKKPHTLSKGEGAVVRAKRATDAGGGSSRRENNCKIKKLNVGLHPTYSTNSLLLAGEGGRSSDEVEAWNKLAPHPHPLLKERGLLLSRNNFPFIQRENRRVRFNAPQPTTMEVCQC